ncbi:MAG: YdeI/OmpD-associated family protein [Limisphaerales bacterium]
MEITEVFYPKKRSQWRSWLKRHHAKKKEIWVRKPHKGSGLPVISYDDLVEEGLCFGWIDGTMKKYDDESSVQRITPRRKKGSFLSELNRQRIWKLQRLDLMTPAGLELIADQVGSPDDPFEIPDWMAKKLKQNRKLWRQFQAFPICYQRLKVGWIAATQGGSQKANEIARQVSERRLDHLIKMTAQNKRYGTEPLADWY